MVCSEFAVLRKNYTQELYTQENKEIFMKIFTRLYFPKCDFNPPIQTREYSGPTGNPALGNIFTEENKFTSMTL